jgi:transcriptional regulator with XRE-family HTH domain
MIRATKHYRAKATLARALGVPRQWVNDWLLGKHEPGGDITLRMLDWVTAEEAKKKSPGSAQTPPERKTRKMKASYEKSSQKSGPDGP